jgi:uncharacterized protein YidB (DUF937 family)
MGLLDSLVGAAEQALGGAQGGQGAPNLGGLVGALLNSGALQGGLPALLQQLQAGGLGEHVQSWLGQGANLPVSADQISQALGGSGGALGQMAQQLGASHGDLAAALSQALPGLIDHLSPNGQMPGGDALSGVLGQLLAGAKPA